MSGDGYPQEYYVAFNFAYTVAAATEQDIPMVSFSEQPQQDYLSIISLPYASRIVAVTIQNGLTAALGASTIKLYGDVDAVPTTLKASGSVTVSSLDTPVVWEPGSGASMAARENWGLSLTSTNNQLEVNGTVLVAVQVPQ